jgi:hypothetical protein
VEVAVHPVEVGVDLGEQAVGEVGDGLGGGEVAAARWSATVPCSRSQARLARTKESAPS